MNDECWQGWGGDPWVLRGLELMRDNAHGTPWWQRGLGLAIGEL